VILLFRAQALLGWRRKTVENPLDGDAVDYIPERTRLALQRQGAEEYRLFLKHLYRFAFAPGVRDVLPCADVHGPPLDQQRSLAA